MDQFVVPQFIDVENKIIGPLTVRQFLTFLVGAGLIFLVFKLSTFWVAAIESLCIFALTGIFAFFKINGRPFHYFLLNMIQTLRRPILKIWNKESVVERTKEEVKKQPPKIFIKKHVTASRLSELSLVVDTGGAYREDQEE
jgi:hypothetical protein